MFKKIKKFFTKSKSKPVNLVEKETAEGWVELSYDNDDDFVLIEKQDAAEEIQANQLSFETELFSKYEVYNLAVDEAENHHRAHAARNRLREQGVSVYDLGSSAGREKGIYLYALVNEQDPNAPITIVCRGTSIDNLNASAVSDLDSKKPGFSVFQKEKAQIIEQLEALYNQFPNRKVRITGHSLGGSLAQLMTQELLVQKKGSSVLSETSQVDTVIFQSGGVDKTVAKQAKEDIIAVKNKDKDFRANFVSCLKEGDLIPRVSGEFLFSDIDSEYVNVFLHQQEFDKPCITLGDALKIGFAAVATGNPLWTVVAAGETLATRHICNRIEVHTDYFFHDVKTKKPKSVQEHLGFYTNTTVEGKAKIAEVFQEDLTESFPVINKLQECLYDCLGELTSPEIQAMGQVADFGLASAECLQSLASGSPQKITVSFGKHVPRLSENCKNLQENAKHAKEGFRKLFKSKTKSC